MTTSQIGFSLTQVYSAITPSGTGLQSPKLGQIYSDGQGNQYRFVKNSHTSDLVVGDVVFYDYQNGVSTEVCRLGASGSGNGLDAMAGAAMGAIPTTGYGWIQFQGDGTANVDGTTDVAIGDSLKGSSGQVYVVKDAAIGTTPAYQNYMRSRVAYTTNSAATKTVLIHCLAW